MTEEMQRPKCTSEKKKKAKMNGLLITSDQQKKRLLKTLGVRWAERNLDRSQRMAP